MIPQKKYENPSSSVPRLVPTFFHKHEYGRDNIIQKKQQQYTKLESVKGIIHRSLFIPTHDIYPPFKRLIFIFYLCLALMVLNISKLHFLFPSVLILHDAHSPLKRPLALIFYKRK
jgi:hypothetical protein